MLLACKSNKEQTIASNTEQQDSTIPKQQVSPRTNGAVVSPTTVSQYISDTFLLPDGTIGYDILKDGSVKTIHQNRIPGLPGNRGFENARQANCVAEIMIQKITKGIFPPSINIDELKHCGIKTE